MLPRKVIQHGRWGGDHKSKAFKDSKVVDTGAIPVSHSQTVARGYDFKSGFPYGQAVVPQEEK
jgi:hypothetical protein